MDWRTTDVFGATQWVRQAIQKVANSGKHRFTLTATQPNRQTFRVVVTYKTGKKAYSKTASTLEYDWYSVNDFEAYYTVGGVLNSDMVEFAMDGREWHGLDGTSPTSWEIRLTLGRNCKAFRGTLGLTDSSDDGAAASFQAVTIQPAATFTGSSVTTGNIKSFKGTLPKPYRISLEATDTSPSGVKGYPAIGDLEFLCAQH